MYNRRKKLLSNRTHILECIYRNAPIARTEIAEMTGITPATVTNTVSSLIAEGIIAEVGEAPPNEASAGRKRILVDIVPSCSYSIGVEFTEKAMTSCICDMKGNIVSHIIVPFSLELAHDITDQVITVVHRLVESSGIDWFKIIGIGVALPGHISLDGSTLVTNRPIWVRFKPDAIRESFSVPVIMENNARCMALGEYLFNPENIPDNFTLFHAGMGMFCANIVDGELFLGHHYLAGEIGHTIVNADGPLCGCGKRGCLQMYSSETRLVHVAKMLYENTSHSMLHHLVPSVDDINIDTVLNAYSFSDPAITSVLDDALKYLSISIANIAITMNPGKIFLHSPMFTPEDIQAELMTNVNRQLTFIGDPYVNSVEILPYSITDGARGACALTIQRFFL